MDIGAVKNTVANNSIEKPAVNIKETSQGSEVQNTVAKQAKNLRVTPEKRNKTVRSHVKDIANEDLEKQMQEIISEINKRITTNTEVSFSMHDASNKLNIKIIDKETKKVIREWPSEKSLDLLAKAIDKESIVLDTKL